MDVSNLVIFLIALSFTMYTSKYRTLRYRTFKVVYDTREILYDTGHYDTGHLKYRTL